MDLLWQSLRRSGESLLATGIDLQNWRAAKTGSARSSSFGIHVEFCIEIELFSFLLQA
jgi:hypothetical protein